MRFKPCDEAEDIKKLTLQAEVPIQETVWMALTRDTDQAVINNIANDDERRAKHCALYLQWALKTGEANAAVIGNTIIYKSKHKYREKRDDMDAKLFSSILQSMEGDSRDLIKRHIVLGYQTGKSVTAKSYHTVNREVGVGGNGTRDVSTGGDGMSDDTSTAVEPISADTGFLTAEERNDWIWLLVAAKETHITKENPIKYYKSYSNKVTERSNSDPTTTTTTIKQNNRQSKSTYKPMKSNSKQVPCDICGFKNHETTKCYHYLHCHATIQEAKTAYVAYKSNDSWRAHCEICGYKYHSADDCKFYRRCHTSIKEAREDYLIYKDKRKGKAGSDSDQAANAPKPKSDPTKGSISEPSNSNKPTYKINFIKSNISINKQSKLPIIEPKDNTLESKSISEDKVILGGEQASDLGVIPERLAKELKIAKCTSCLTGFGGAETRVAGHVKNTLGYSIVDKSEYLKNTVNISHYPMNDCWNYLYHHHRHMSLVSKGGKYNIKFEVDPAMPQAAKEFYRLYNKNNHVLNNDKYYSTNKINNKYLSKYNERRGSINLIRCSTINNNYNNLFKLKDMKPTETIQSGDPIPFGDLPPVAFERDYGQQVIANGLDPSVQKIGVKSPGSPSYVIRAEKSGVKSPGSPSRVI
jgi:hypothetical protein